MIEIKQQWRARRREQPLARARDFAREQGVSEAELVASFCGDGAVRLTNYWAGIFSALPTLNRVMALTRNEYVVHERKGRYGPPEFFGTMGQVLGDEIDLRLFTNHWQHGFALHEETSDGPRLSLQFFDCYGTAIHKIYLQPESDYQAFETLVKAHTHPDQKPVLQVEPAKTPVPATVATIDGPAFQSAWDALQDTHDFFGLLKRFGLSRTQALRAARSNQAQQIVRSSLSLVLHEAAATALPIMVFVANPGLIQIHTGPVKRIVTHGPWLNVLDEDFNLHVREDLIHDVWMVCKPTRDGIVTSLELFDAAGEQIALLFGKRKPGQPESAGWRSLIHELPGA